MSRGPEDVSDDERVERLVARAEREPVVSEARGGWQRGA